VRRLCFFREGENEVMALPPAVRFVKSKVGLLNNFVVSGTRLISHDDAEAGPLFNTRLSHWEWFNESLE
jgi:hypothetical protein